MVSRRLMASDAGVDAHRLAGGRALPVVGELDQAVGRRHRGEDAGALGAGAAHVQAAIVGGVEDAAQEVGAALPAIQGLVGDGGEPAWSDGAASLQPRQQRGHELQEGDHHRHGIAGQPQEGHAALAQQAAGQGASGTDGDAPERQAADRLQGGPGEVGLAHRDAAAGDHHVGAVGGLAQRGLHGLAVVGQDAEVDRLGALLGEQAHQGVAVGVIDAGRGQRPAGGDHLVTGGEEGHPGPAMDPRLGEPQGGQQPELRGPQPRAGVEHPPAAGDVLAGTPHVLAPADALGPVDRHPLAA